MARIVASDFTTATTWMYLVSCPALATLHLAARASLDFNFLTPLATSSRVAAGLADEVVARRVR